MPREQIDRVRETALCELVDQLVEECEHDNAAVAAEYLVEDGDATAYLTMATLRRLRCGNSKSHAAAEALERQLFERTLVVKPKEKDDAVRKA